MPNPQKPTPLITLMKKTPFVVAPFSDFGKSAEEQIEKQEKAILEKLKGGK